MPHPDRAHVQRLLQRERALFAERHPASRAQATAAAPHLFAGVPMPWQVEWESPFPLFIRKAQGARLTDVDGNEYVDLCLGDTGAMFGHSPPALVEMVRRDISQGITHMLPTEDAAWIGADLTARFGLPRWSFTLTATDANRFATRVARQLTGRPKILVMDGCYHGTHDETLVRLDDGVIGPRSGSVGPPVDPALTTRVVEFNDLAALERELAHGDVACVLMEPALTNSGMVLPDPGYLEALREMTQRHDVLLIIDETHTISSGPGGYTQAFGLKPDMLVVGKPIGGGIPAAVYGMTADLAARFTAGLSQSSPVIVGIGGTLAGNALSLRAVRTMLSEVITPASYAHMFAMAERLEAGIQRVIDTFELPWHVTRMGARVEYGHTPNPRRTSKEVEATTDSGLEKFMHMYCLNRGVIITPFHNMMLMSPVTSEADVDRHNELFEACARELIEEPRG